MDKEHQRSNKKKTKSDVTFRGVAVSKGVGVGTLILRKKEAENRHTFAGAPEEIRRFDSAIADVITSYHILYEDTQAQLGEDAAAIFFAYQRMAEDEVYRDSVYRWIREKELCAEEAVLLALDEFAKPLLQSEDPYLRERASDIREVTGSVQKYLTTEDDSFAFWDDAPGVLWAEELFPTEFMRLKNKKIAAIVTAKGSYTAHVSILAREKKVPMVVGMPSAFASEIRDGCIAVVDGNTGEVTLHFGG